MINSMFRKTALASLVAATFTAVGAPQAQANLVNVSWSGAFTMLGPTSITVPNSGSTYSFGYYSTAAGGKGASTAHGWYGYRTPVSGTMSFDTHTGAGVGTINPFFFFGTTPGSGQNTDVVRASGVTFKVIDTVGDMIGTMLFSWNGGPFSVSIVLNASGMLASLPGLIAGGPTSSVSAVGVLPATNGVNLGSTTMPVFLPLGPSPVATETLNTGPGCNGLTLATKVNAYTITTNNANVITCMTGMTNDTIGGSPLSSPAIPGFNANFDFSLVYFDSVVLAPVPVPAAAWLFGSGLIGLMGVIRKRKAA